MGITVDLEPHATTVAHFLQFVVQWRRRRSGHETGKCATAPALRGNRGRGDRVRPEPSPGLRGHCALSRLPNQPSGDRRLDERGAFLIKKSVEQVAERLGVSRFTIYNYLDQANRDGGSGPAERDG